MGILTQLTRIIAVFVFFFRVAEAQDDLQQQASLYYLD